MGFFYRDADLGDKVFEKYRPGMIIQERAFVDCSYLDGGLAARHRYLIITGKARDLHARRWSGSPPRPRGDRRGRHGRHTMSITSSAVLPTTSALGRAQGKPSQRRRKGVSRKSDAGRAETSRQSP